MSCRGRCGGNSGGGQLTPEGFEYSDEEEGAWGGPRPQRNVHISMERSPTRPAESPGMYPEYQAAGYGNMRIPTGARASTPGPYGYSSNQFDSFGSQINNDYNLTWMPKDINISELLEQGAVPQISSRFRRGEPNLRNIPQQQPSSQTGVTSTPAANANPLLDKAASKEETATTPEGQKIDKKRQESLIEWFDRSVEKELKKHKETSFTSPSSYSPPPAAISIEEPHLNLSKGTLERLAGASASQIEICLDLRKEPDTDLTEAVDKYAKAEAMCQFADAVKAAEAASVIAPPDLAEEAALASARGFGTDVKTTSLQGELEGVRPIEIVGYVGVTKPKYPTKRKQ